MQGAFGGIVRQTDSPIIEEPAEGGPALQHIVDCLRHVGVARHLAAHTAHPTLKIIHESGDPLLPHGTTLFDRQAVEGALDVEDRVDPSHSFDRQRPSLSLGSWGSPPWG